MPASEAEAARHPLRRSIAWRLALGLGVVVLSMGVVSIASIAAFADMSRRLDAAEQDECKARGVVQLAGLLRDQYAYTARTIIIGNDSHAGVFRDASRKLRARAAEVRALPGLPEARGRIDDILAASATIERLFETRVLPLVQAGDRAALTVFEEQILHLAMQAQNAEELARKTEEGKEDLSREFRAAQRRAVLLAILAQVVALALAVLVGVLLYRWIARPISTLSAAVTRVGAGDLETEVSIERGDEIGQLARRFNEMTRAIKDNQARLLRTERLAGLGRMAAGIAHEMNNPVGVILGYAKLLRHRGTSADPKMLEAIEVEAERCHQVIEGLLDLTRNTVHAIRSTSIDLRELAGRVAACSKLAGRAPGVSIEISGAATVVGDETKLHQVLVNLVGNAAEACGPTGQVLVTVEQSKSHMASIAVSDTGPGIDPNHRARIFDPFFTTKSNGTGLGLPISRAIARAHGGDVVLAINGGTGATFVLTLPAEQQPLA